jgi:hypothetical protein
VSHPVIDHAMSYLGTHDGSPFLKFFGLKPPTAWCAAFAIGCWIMTAPTNHLPRSAACYQLWVKANANPMRYAVISATDAQWGVKIQTADIAIFSHSPTHSEWLGHAALVIKPLEHGHFQSIEGNTSPNNKGDQRMGNTVAIKNRYAGMRTFWLEGFFRERNPPKLPDTPAPANTPAG